MSRELSLIGVKEALRLAGSDNPNLLETQEYALSYHVKQGNIDIIKALLPISRKLKNPYVLYSKTDNLEVMKLLKEYEIPTYEAFLSVCMTKNEKKIKLFFENIYEPNEPIKLYKFISIDMTVRRDPIINIMTHLYRIFANESCDNDFSSLIVSKLIAKLSKDDKDFYTVIFDHIDTALNKDYDKIHYIYCILHEAECPLPRTTSLMNDIWIKYFMF